MPPTELPAPPVEPLPAVAPIRSRLDAIEHLLNAATTPGDRTVIATAQAIEVLVDDQTEDDPRAEAAAALLLGAALDYTDPLPPRSAVRALRELGRVDDDELDELGVEL